MKLSRMHAWYFRTNLECLACLPGVFKQVRNPPARLHGIFEISENVSHACMAFSNIEKTYRMLAWRFLILRKHLAYLHGVF